MTLAGALAYVALWFGVAFLLAGLWATATAVAAGMRRRRSRP